MKRLILMVALGVATTTGIMLVTSAGAEGPSRAVESERSAAQLYGIFGAPEPFAE